jgi:hypothetical protein
MGFFENLAQKSFRKMVRGILAASVPNFEQVEGSLPSSTVENNYNVAWDKFGKSAHKMHPSIYREECVKAAEYVAEAHLAAISLFYGNGSSEEAG